MQVEQLQQVWRPEPLEGREREEKERDLIGDRDYSCWPENHWDIKSTELRRLHYQVSFGRIAALARCRLLLQTK